MPQTPLRKYELVPDNVAPDVPYWLNRALMQMDADIGAVAPSGGYSRGEFPTNTNINDAATPVWNGLWTVTATILATLTGDLPPGLPRFMLDVKIGTDNQPIQFAYGNQNNTAIFWRDRATLSQIKPLQWNPWKRLDDQLAVSTLPNGTDVNTLRSSGTWYTGGYGSVETLFNVPQIIDSSGRVTPGIIKVTASGSATFVTQEFITYGKDSVTLERSSTTPSAWADWKPASVAPKTYASIGAGTPSQLRVQRFKDAYPLASTQGKGVVCFRYDHGLSFLKTKLLAVHRAAKIPFYVAMNSRLWNIAENSDTTQAEARSWIAEGIAEFGNHSASHDEVTTAEAIYDQIVNGRVELEQQLGTTIHGFTVPGLTGDRWQGFGYGTVDSFSSTLAGALILANHAVTSGWTPNETIFRPLDGLVRQAQKFFVWEDQTWEAIKFQIDTAINTKTALTLMCHPKNVGIGGYVNTPLATQVINYVRDQIAAGKLANLSYYQSHHATLGAV